MIIQFWIIIIIIIIIIWSYAYYESPYTLYNGENVIFHVIALEWTNQRAITLFCIDTGAKSVIVRSPIGQKFSLCAEAYD